MEINFGLGGVPGANMMGYDIVLNEIDPQSLYYNFMCTLGKVEDHLIY